MAKYEKHRHKGTINDVLVKWIEDAIASSKGQLSAAGLARYMGVSKAKVSRMLSGIHPVQTPEIHIISSYLGVPAPVASADTVTPIASPLGRVRIVGRLHKSAWQQIGSFGGDTSDVAVDTDGQIPLDDMRAFAAAATSSRCAVATGSTIIGVPVDKYRPLLQTGDLVVTRRTQSQFENFSLAEVAKHVPRRQPTLTAAFDGDGADDIGTAAYWVIKIVRNLI